MSEIFLTRPLSMSRHAATPTCSACDMNFSLLICTYDCTFMLRVTLCGHLTSFGSSARLLCTFKIVRFCCVAPFLAARVDHAHLQECNRQTDRPTGPRGHRLSGLIHLSSPVLVAMKLSDASNGRAKARGALASHVKMSPE
jgi:hypothetical protein